MNRLPNSGSFKRQLHPWTPSRWDEGWVMNKGRFVVYRPDYPRCYEGGYALRAHVVYWLRHDLPHPQGTNLHHVNSDRLDDRYENLELIAHSKHAQLHNPRHTKTCANCGAEFYRRGKPDAKFCSHSCYTQAPRTADTRKRMSKAQKARPRKTHCKRGHPFSGDNLFITSQGTRGCRTCRLDNQRKWHKR